MHKNNVWCVLSVKKVVKFLVHVELNDMCDIK